MEKEEGIIICAQFLDFKSTRDGGFIIRFETGETEGPAAIALKSMRGHDLNLHVTEAD